MIINTFKITLITLIMNYLSVDCYSQYTNLPYRYNLSKHSIPRDSLTNNKMHPWFNIGIGGDNNGISFGCNINIPVTKHSIFSVRYIRSAEVNISWFCAQFKDPLESVNDLSALFGFYFRSRHVFFSASSGTALTFGTLRGNLIYIHHSGWLSRTEYYEGNKFLTIGLPLQAQCYWFPSKTFGIGLNGYANINKDKNIWGAMLNIAIGGL